MEEDLRRPLPFPEGIDEAFDLKERDWSQYSALTLAFLGDAVFELFVRTVLVTCPTSSRHDCISAPRESSVPERRQK